MLSSKCLFDPFFFVLFSFFFISSVIESCGKTSSQGLCDVFVPA